MDVDTLLAPVNVDRWTRDRWGRPMVIPAGGGAPVPYGRPSGFGIVLEDRFGLNKWQTRMAVLGVTQRPDLAAQIAAASDDRTRDTLIEQAQEAAGASSGANLGSALHTFTEHVDLGRDVTVPAPWDADVEAYKAALAAHGIEILPDAIELDIVCDELELAGTCDRIVRWDGRMVMADLKTGKKITDPALGYSVQLAVYANSLRYTHATGERHDLGVDTSVGLIIHLPAGQARCDIHAVDLEQAWELALLAREVKRAQKRKGIVTKFVAAEGTAVLAADDATATPDSPAPGVAVAPSELVTQLRDELAAAITNATDEERQRIAAAWPPGLGRLSTLTTRDELQAVQRVVVDVVGFVGTLEVPSAEQLIERLGNLPGDLLAAVEAEALGQKVPNLRGPHVRPEHLAVVARLCDEAGAEHARRVQEVAEALEDLDVDTQRAVMTAATDGRTTWPDELLELEAERVVALAAASTWLVQLDGIPLVAAQQWDQLVDRLGGKQAVVTAAKALAVPHGRPMPRSAADVAADPVLAALVAAS